MTVITYDGRAYENIIKIWVEEPNYTKLELITSNCESIFVKIKDVFVISYNDK